MIFCKFGLSVIEVEAQAITELSQRIDQNFEKACELLLACKGKIIVTGIGKSGHIGNKIAATLASTGSPAFFVHTGEACHGDLGMITRNDIVIAISNSGNTNELLLLIPLLKRLEIPLIALCGNPHSELAKYADINIDLSIKNEACPLGLAPTTSTTVSLVMGDAIAVALLQARGFSAEDFALSHPAGTLGKRLLRIDELWHPHDALPIVHEDVCIKEALLEVTTKKLGLTCVVNTEKQLVGIYTDGDIRRTLNAEYDIHITPLKEVMTKNCKTAHPGMLATEALAIMQKYTITALVVIDEKHRPHAIIHLHDLLKAGII